MVLCTSRFFLIFSQRGNNTKDFIQEVNPIKKGDHKNQCDTAAFPKSFPFTIRKFKTQFSSKGTLAPSLHVTVHFEIAFLYLPLSQYDRNTVEKDIKSQVIHSSCIYYIF